jgi:hypothetical protein
MARILRMPTPEHLIGRGPAPEPGGAIRTNALRLAPNQ